MKVLFLTNVPSPYRVLFFQEFGKKCDLTVLYEVNRATDRDEKWVATVTEPKSYKEVYLRAIRADADTALCFEVIDYLVKGYDRIIVGGYSTPTARYAIRYMKQHKISYWLNCDGGFAKTENVLKRLVKTYYISGAIGYLSTGFGTDEYLLHYGAKKEAIHHYPFSSVSADMVLSELAKTETKKSIRERLFPGLKDKKYIIITVGQLIPRKGIDLLLQAAKDLPDDIGYCIVGGEAPSEYRRYVKDNHLENVLFVPFQKYDLLKEYYRAADLFVLPTREDIWGLVVNEAMANGLPVVTTKRCLAGRELVKESRNGKLIPVDDVEALKAAISSYVDLPEEEHRKQAEYSLQIIRDYTIEQMAQTHMDIFEQKRVLMVGNLVSEDLLMKTSTTSAAANRFQEKIVKYLKRANNAVETVSYVAEPLVEQSAGLIYKKQAGVFGTFGAIRDIRKTVKNKVRNTDIILCYNMIYAWLYLPRLARKYHKKLVLILADYSGVESYHNPIKKFYARMQLKAIQTCDVVVGLSANMQQYVKPSQNFILMEGGIDPEILQNYEQNREANRWKKEADGKPILVYSGLLNDVAGIGMLLDAVAKNDKEFVLNITGRGEYAEQIQEIAKHDQRIRYLGLLEEKEYLAVLESADILINPRNMKLPENQHNFPSKIMDYLATGNTILSTKFAGYEKFADVICFCETSAEALSDEISRMIHEGPDDATKKQERRNFAKKFLWDEQVKRMMEA